jgi:hypothetical protein
MRRNGDRREFRVCVEFDENVLHVVPHRVDTQAESRRHRPVGEPFGNQHQHLALAGCQLADKGRGGTAFDQPWQELSELTTG